jgi:hypothetical protein
VPPIADATPSKAQGGEVHTRGGGQLSIDPKTGLGGRLGSEHFRAHCDGDGGAKMDLVMIRGREMKRCELVEWLWTGKVRPFIPQGP